MIDGLRIKALETSDTGDWLDFFDNRAFKDNPDWRGCYCCYFHKRGVENGQPFYDGENGVPLSSEGRRIPKRNRAAALIERKHMRGYVAYVADRVVGWCNVNRKSAFGLLKSDEEAVLAVACFVVEKDFRRQGVSRALLSRAIEDARAAGYKAIEAYPKFRASSEAGHFHGHPDMLSVFGFAKIKAGRSTIMRLELS